MNHKLTCCLLGAVLMSSVDLSAQEWSMYQGDASHSGYLDIAIDPSSIWQAWSLSLSKWGLGSATSSDGRVFVGGSENLWCIDSASGRVLWSHPFSRSTRINPPSYANGRVYIQIGDPFGSSHQLRCYDAKTGSLIFSTPYPAYLSSHYAPTMYDGKVYINGGAPGGMSAFDATSGNKLWSTRLQAMDLWTPAVDELHAYAYVDGVISKLDRHTGVILDSFQEFSSRPYPDMDLAPVLGGRDDLLAVSDGNLLSFDLQKRNTRFSIKNKFQGQPAVHGGVIYALTQSALEARDQGTGQLLWSWTEAGQVFDGNVVITARHAIVCSRTWTFLVDLETHDDVFFFPVAGKISVADNAILIASGLGYMTRLAFDQLPNPTSVEPARAHYQFIPLTVTVRGVGFSSGGQTKVWFGGTEASNVTVVNDSEITCDPPRVGRGVLDVRVGNSKGSMTEDRAWTLYPSLEVLGQTRVGGQLDSLFQCAKQDHILALVGLPAKISTKIPGFGGELEVDQPITFASVQYWLGTEFRVVQSIPADPSLLNLKLAVQGLVLPSSGLVGASFTNTEPVVIR